MSASIEALERLWSLMPRDHEVWRHVEPGLRPEARWREVVELLCGATWHLEQAVRVSPFDAEQYNKLRDIDKRPWQTWLDSRSYSSPQSDAHQAGDLAATNIQSMLLADAVLRLAGAWEILEDLGRLGQCQSVARMGTLNDALNSDGRIKTGTDPTIEGLLVLRAVRDTFMYGELSRDGRTARHHNRNALYKSAAYAPAAIFEYCLQASELMFRLFNTEYRAGA